MSMSQPPFFIDKMVLGPLDGWGFAVNNQPGKLYNLNLVYVTVLFKYESIS